MPVTHDSATRAPHLMGEGNDLLASMMRIGPLQEGRNATDWPGLSVVRFSQPGHQVMPFMASLCVAIQGEKRIYVGNEAFTYGPLQYLVVSLALPLEAEITRASVQDPFLGLVLEFDMGLLGQLLIDMEGSAAPTNADLRLGGRLRGHSRTRPNQSQGDRIHPDEVNSPVYVSPMDKPLEEALGRLLRALTDPLDRQALATSINREILYRLIRGEQGDRVRSLALQNGASRRMARIVRYLSEHFSEPIAIEQLARDWGLSTSALHHSFHKATGMSPLQFLKKTRLHRARALMLDEGMDASSAAYEVGYGSLPQFSREFKRMFGMCPSDVRRQRSRRALSRSW